MKLFKRNNKAAAENANLIVLSDGTHKEKGGKGKKASKKKTTTKKSKKGGLFSRKKNSKKSKKQSSSKVLEAVTIQYPGIPNAEGGGVELDLSFDTATTELDQFLAELEAVTPEKDNNKDKKEPLPGAKEEEPTSTSVLGRAFPRLFDEEGYMRCGCGPSSAPEDVNDDDLTVTSGNKSSDKETKTGEANITVTTSTVSDNNGDHSKVTATTNNGDHSKAKDIPEKANATPSTTSDATTETSKANIEYVCNSSEKAAPKATASKKQKDKNTKKGKAKASAVSKAAAAKGAVAATRSAKPSRPPTTSSTRNKTPATSLAKTPSRIVAKGEYSGPVSLDAFYKEEDPDDDASKKEVEQISLMENYKSENESLKAEIQRLKHLKTLEEENESLKAEVLKLQMGMSVVSKMAQDIKQGGEKKKDEDGTNNDPAQIQKEWEDGAVTGMFVRLANMFDDDGFIKCMTPTEN